MYDVSIIADWLILNVDGVTNKKLQKLLYYAFAWHLTLFNEDADHLDNILFNAPIQAWTHGPVVPSMYNKFKSSYFHVIPKDGIALKVSDIDPDTLDLLNQIKNVYGKYNGNELENISHKEEPWKNARKNCPSDGLCSNELDKKVIYSYYNKRLGLDA